MKKKIYRGALVCAACMLASVTGHSGGQTRPGCMQKVTKPELTAEKKLPAVADLPASALLVLIQS